MLKKIDGLWYMTGTSDKSLYPVVLWDDKTGFHAGLRLDMMKPKDAPEGIWALQMYLRVQFFNENGGDMPFDYAAVAKVIPNIELRFASQSHASNAIGNGIVNTAQEEAYKAVAAWQEGYKGFVNKVAKKAFISRLVDDALDQIIADRFQSVMNLGAAKPKPVADIAKNLEADLDSVDAKLDKTFDFTKMFGSKPKGDGEPA